MENIKVSCCKTCGGELDPRIAVEGVVKCKFCGNLWTIPKEKATSESIHFLKMGEHELDTCKFDDAYESYRKAAEIDPEEPEAYFGMALANFCVQYLRDDVQHRVQPICHENSEHQFLSLKFVNDVNYKQAMKLATPKQAEVYKERAEEIDYIRAEFLRLKESGLDYDCFICVKVTDNETDGRTVDYGIADDIYFDLKGRGFKVFFSEREIKDAQGADYEARILYALYSSECMLVVCTDDKYLQTPWVKNEYTRFLSMIAAGNENKEHDSITIVFDGKPIEKLHGRKGRIQGIDWNNKNAGEQIRNFVDKHSPQGRERRAEAERKKQEEQRLREEEARRTREEQEKLRAELERQQREIAEKLSNIQNSAAATTGGASVQSLLMRAEQFLEDNDTESAEKYYNMVLDADPQNSPAWWGLFLLEFKVKSGNSIIDALSYQKLDEIGRSRNYRNAVKYASGSMEEQIAFFENELHNPRRWWQLFLAEMGMGNEDAILRNVSVDVKRRISQSKNFANVKKYVNDDFAPTLKAFEAGLNSPESAWALFLEENGVKKESAILDKIASCQSVVLDTSQNYLTACRNAEGELRKRIDAFQARLNGSEIWWEAFLREMKVQYEDDILLSFHTFGLSKIENSVYYQKACQNVGDDEYGERINKFNAALEKFDLWWKQFLHDFHWQSENEFLNSKFDVDLVKKVTENPHFKKAQEYADENEKKRINNFLSKIEEQLGYARQATQAWDELLKKHGVKTNEQLQKVLVADLRKDPLCVKAMSMMSKAKDNKRLKAMRGTIEAQEKFYAKNAAERRVRARRIRRIVFATLMSFAVLAMHVLALLDVPPINYLWFAIIPNRIARIVICSVVTFYFTIPQLINLAVNKSDRRWVGSFWDPVVAPLVGMSDAWFFGLPLFIALFPITFMIAICRVGADRGKWSVFMIVTDVILLAVGFAPLLLLMFI